MNLLTYLHDGCKLILRNDIADPSSKLGSVDVIFNPDRVILCFVQKWQRWVSFAVVT